MEIKLRDYQSKIIGSLRNEIKNGSKRMLMVAPTGAGKTIMFSFLVSEHIKRGGRVLVFTHRKELLKQAGGTFEKFGLTPERITAGKFPSMKSNLHVAMIETFARRIESYLSFLQSRTMIIIDEAHLSTFEKVFPHFSENTLVIGATATPYRKGAKAKGLDEFYSAIVQEVDTPELISNGFLSPARTYAVKVDLSKAKKYGDDYDMSEYYKENRMWHGVVRNWENIAKGTKTLLFSSNVENSVKVAEEFNLMGYEARHIDGNTPGKIRDEILDWFDKTRGAIVCNCGILNAGFDQSDIETVILYRATTSLPLFLQMCGRGSRIHEGKTHFNILDFGNNVHRMDFWEAPRIWSLKKDVTRSNKEDAMPIKICKKCTAVVPVSTKVCPYCNTDFVKTKSEKIAELELITSDEIKTAVAEGNFETLELIAEAKGYHKRWVVHQIGRDVEKLKAYAAAKGYHQGWVHRQL